MSETENRVIEQETDREAGKSITITFSPIGAVEEGKETKLFKEKGEDADSFFLRSINATYGFRMHRVSWKYEHDTTIGQVTTSTEAVKGLRIGDETVTSFLESELNWFKEALLPLLIDQSDVEIIQTTKEVEVVQKPLSRYDFFSWDETPEWHDDRVTLEYIDLRNGKASILVQGEQGSDLQGDEVNGAIKGYHDIIMTTIRSMTCTDENEYSRDCKSLIKVASHRVCDTSFLN